MVRQTQVQLVFSLRKVIPFISILLLPLMFAAESCNKAISTTDEVISEENDPVMLARNIDLLFSDSGRIQAKLVSEQMNRYAGEHPYIEFPKGFKIYMFDSVQQVTSTISGDKGIRREYEHIMEAWGNVVVRNETTNEQIDTEHLIWDEFKHKIRSDVKVKITRPDQVLYGSGMESNEAFTRYSIWDISGEMEVKKDSI